MSGPWTGELVWSLQRGPIRMQVVVPPKTFAQLGGEDSLVQVSNLRVPLVQTMPRQFVYRHPITLTRDGSALSGGPVYAILAATGSGSFIGARTNYRDLMDRARQRKTFVFVVPTANVSSEARWTGYVRLGYQRWIRIPCPRPEAMYNRIPNRNLENDEYAVRAKALSATLSIPMFNPDYFNKAVIYRVIQQANLSQFLPDTTEAVSRVSLYRMLNRHRAVYLKPTGGSIGHGMIRIEKTSGQYLLRVLKNSRCQSFYANNMNELWSLVQRHRLAGKYVIQSAIRLLEWKGRPCDFRTLLQKRGGQWTVVGKGVRVSGKNTITTHVPNGGFIESADKVLAGQFGSDQALVSDRIDRMAIRCAVAIDTYYADRVGEMSMDIGVDTQGQPWFLEANAKPMKFDEPDIRIRSLDGVLTHLDELRGARVNYKIEE